jgi:hypothetical protein
VLSFHGNGNGEGIVCKRHASRESTCPTSAPMRP